MLFEHRHVIDKLPLLEKTRFVFKIWRIHRCTEKATFELLGREKSRPARKRSSCVAMLDNNNEISVIMLNSVRTTIFPT